jgi:hypothetical protein
MKPIHGVTIALLLCCQLITPVRASAQARADSPLPASPEALQGAPTGTSSSPGGRFLRNVLIGAAIGGTLTGILGRGLGDCGNCSGDTAKAIASGAMYGALFGAAINVRPSRRAWPSQRTTISSNVSRHVKAVNVAVRF